jgi:hypothetical protein
MPIADLFEIMYLVLAREQGSPDRVDGRITPALIVESTLLIKIVEELGVGLASPQFEIADLKVRPDWAPMFSSSDEDSYEHPRLTVASVVSITAIIGEE